MHIYSRRYIIENHKFEATPKMEEAKPSEKVVEAPNLFERAEEKNEANIHTKESPHHHKETHGTSDDIDENTPIGDVKAPNVFERAKEEVEALVETIHLKKESKSHSPRHHKETHGTSDDIDENTPIDEVKGPNVFERAKEEIEALVQSFRSKK